MIIEQKIIILQKTGWDFCIQGQIEGEKNLVGTRYNHLVALHLFTSFQGWPTFCSAYGPMAMWPNMAKNDHVLHTAIGPYAII